MDGGLWIAMCSAKIVHLKADESTVTYGREEGVPAGALDKIFSFPDGSVWMAGSTFLLSLRQMTVLFGSIPTDLPSCMSRMA
jgi:hypothetical protein